ncbi:oxygenase MpaB family protein [Nonomuraea fastidiosa]|uniref:oxygenase MpaB family protein n=1 Tax=Nonomuraea fastidiosa TaxID=46173 RepID=UPI00366F3A09
MSHTSTRRDADVFGPDSLLRPLVHEARWGLAVLRATLLEAAHPQIGAALMENSTFLTHPWRRLRNTAMSARRLAASGPRRSTPGRGTGRGHRLPGAAARVDRRGPEASQARSRAVAGAAAGSPAGVLAREPT